MGKKLKIVIVGGTVTGIALSNTLSSKKNEVVVIERSEEKAKELSRKLDALVICGDGTNVEVLREAGVPDCDAIVVCTGHDNDNLMICTIARSMGVPKIIPLANDPRDEQLFTRLGVKLLVPIVETTVTAILELLYRKGEERVIDILGEGDVEVIQLALSEHSALVGKPPSELKNAIVCVVERNGELIVPKNSFKLEAGDLLTISVKTEDISDLIKAVGAE
jgi:trk system potassium uptake protein TrkA